MSIKLDKAKCRISGFLKFNSSFLDEKNFRDHLVLMIKRELTEALLVISGSAPLKIELDLLLSTLEGDWFGFSV